MPRAPRRLTLKRPAGALRQAGADEAWAPDRSYERLSIDVDRARIRPDKNIVSHQFRYRPVGITRGPTARALRYIVTSDICKGSKV